MTLFDFNAILPPRGTISLKFSFQTKAWLDKSIMPLYEKMQFTAAKAKDIAERRNVEAKDMVEHLQRVKTLDLSVPSFMDEALIKVW